MNEDLCKIRIKNENKNLVLRKLIINNISYKEFNELDNKIYFIIKYKDFLFLKNYYKKNIKIISYFGKKGILNFLKREYIFVLSITWAYILLLILTNTCFKIIINTKDVILKEKIILNLEEHGLKKYGFKKDYNSLDHIKKEILKENDDSLEWIEIKESGTTYIIEITPRIIEKKEVINDVPSNIVASKDALIKYITASRGEVLKEVNDYVKKGEVLITGNIYKNEETLKKQVQAQGKVYGEVWYTVNITIPYSYIEYVSTGKKVDHYYMDIFGLKMTLLGKYDTKMAMSEKSTILDKPYLFFKIYKEKKELYEYKTITITKEEAINEAIRRSTKSIKASLNKDEYIINKKVLNINAFSSKINVEIFYKVYEDITSTEEIVILNNGE